MSMFQHPERRTRGARRSIVLSLVTILVIAGGYREAVAQPSPGDRTPHAGGTSIPDQFKINMLIRTTLIALSQANQTGNYSVLLKIATCSSERLAAVIEHLEEFGETNTSLILANNPAPVIIKKQIN